MVRTRSGCGAGAIAAGKGEAGDTSGGFEGGRGRIWMAAGAIRMLLIVYAVWHDSNCEDLPMHVYNIQIHCLSLPLGTVEGCPFCPPSYQTMQQDNGAKSLWHYTARIWFQSWSGVRRALANFSTCVEGEEWELSPRITPASAAHRDLALLPFAQSLSNIQTSTTWSSVTRQDLPSMEVRNLRPQAENPQ